MDFRQLLTTPTNEPSFIYLDEEEMFELQQVLKSIVRGLWRVPLTNPAYSEPGYYRDRMERRKWDQFPLPLEALWEHRDLESKIKGNYVDYRDLEVPKLKVFGDKKNSRIHPVAVGSKRKQIHVGIVLKRFLLHGDFESVISEMGYKLKPATPDGIDCSKDKLIRSIEDYLEGEDLTHHPKREELTRKLLAAMKVLKV